PLHPLPPPLNSFPTRRSSDLDIVVRYLRHSGCDVLYVQNITDVGHLTDDADEGEDKIARRAQERRVEPMALVETYTREYFQAMEDRKSTRLNSSHVKISYAVF